MKNAIRELAFHYFEEVKNSKPQTAEELYYMADNFVKDIERLISARKDFEEE